MLSRPGDPGTFRPALAAACLAIGRPPAPAALSAFEAHYRLLRHWGRRMNLTGLEDETAIIKRHFLEPIAAADCLGGEGALLDLGSGNGFPAIPLKVLHPGLRLVLVESSEKKSAFLWAVIRGLGLEEARVVTRRIGRPADLADLLPCRYLTVRAIRLEGVFRPAGPPILEPGGRALFFVSREAAENLRRSPPPGLNWIETRPLPSGPKSTVAVFGSSK